MSAGSAVIDASFGFMGLIYSSLGANATILPLQILICAFEVQAKQVHNGLQQSGRRLKPLAERIVYANNY
jgi:hypothetical protein